MIFLKKKNFDRRIFKKSPEELEQYQMFKRRGSFVPSKKGKGSFKRHSKHGLIAPTGRASESESIALNGWNKDYQFK